MSQEDRQFPHLLERLIPPNWIFSRLENGISVIAIQRPDSIGSFTVSVRAESQLHPAENQYTDRLILRNFLHNRSIGENPDFRIPLNKQYVTGNRVLSILTEFPIKSTANALNHLKNALAKRSVPAEIIAEERHALIQELDLRNADPQYSFDLEVKRQLFGKNEYPLPAEKVSVLAKIDENRSAELLNARLNTENILFIISGNEEPEKLLAYCDSVFSNIRSIDQSADFLSRLGNEDFKSKWVIVGNINSSFPVLTMAWAAPGTRFSESDVFTASLLETILNDPGSKFQQSIRKTGVVKGLAASYVPGVRYGTFKISLSVNPEPGDAVLDSLFENLKRLRSFEYFNATEFLDMKKGSIYQRKLREEIYLNKCLSISEAWALSDLPLYTRFNHVTELIDRVTVARWAEEYLLNPFSGGVLLANKSEWPGIEERLQQFYSLENLSEEKEEEKQDEAELKRAEELRLALEYLKKVEVRFELNSREPTTQSVTELRKIADLMKKFPEIRLYIEGHTDSRGSASYNKDLSLSRARQIRDLLISEYDVKASRMKARGYGEDRLKYNEFTEEGRLRNRRVSLKPLTI